MTSRPVTALDDRPASLGRRFLAVLVDQLVVLVLGGGVVAAAAFRAATELRGADADAAAVPGPLLVTGAVLATAVTVTQWLLHGRFGWTVGRRLLGVRTVDVHGRHPVGLVRVLVRELVVAAGVLACGLGQYVVLLSPLFDRTGRLRGWHDRVVDAEVLRVAHPSEGRASGSGARLAPRGGRRPASAAGADDEGFRPPAPPAPGAAASTSDGPAVSTAPAADGSAPATPAGGLVLAPVNQARAAADLDTRAIPAVRAAPTLAFGLAPELELTRPAPPRTDVVPEPRPGTAAGLRVALDDGRVFSVARHAVVGRNPTPGAGAQVVRVVDPERSVSKTHLQLAVDASGGAWVVDRGSTNGTLVTLPDGAQVVCPVDHPVRLRQGAVVSFGDRSLRVVSTPATEATHGASR